MKFTIQDPPKPGELRVRSFFAWWPIEINKEIRWWEYVYVEVRWHQAITEYGSCWENTRFLTREEAWPG